MKKTAIITTLLLLPFIGQAKSLSSEEALGRLGGNAPAKAKALKGSALRLCHTELTRSGQPGVYVFNRAEGGYLILPADDNAAPILGYSDTGLSQGVIPEPMQWWLEEYARQIEYIREMEKSAPASAKEFSIPRPEREPIAPMLKTSWDQDEPYYDMCPMAGTERTYTGCVATAMAQVMKYWEYPAKGSGTISYDAESIQKRLELNFSLRSFDWDNMLPTYSNVEYTQTQADAVAYLMKACGYAVKMDYGTDSSGALSMLIPRAFTKYFKYDQGCREVLRQYYSLSEWETLIYDQLKNVGPVLYGGGSLIGGGHSFVCDGYDTDGYFHFNWGWTGMSNGYYLLDCLNPYATGIGGGAGGGYNFTQDAIIGIQPPTGEAYEHDPITLSQNGSFAGYIKDGKLYFDLFAEEGAMFVNYEPTTLKLQLGVIIEGQNVEGFESRGVPMTDVHFSLEPGYGTAPSLFEGGLVLKDLNLPDGTYKLTSATLLDAEGSEWTPTRTNREYFNYIWLKKSGNAYSVEVEGVDRLQVVEGGLRSQLYYGTHQKVYVKVHNYADHEISRGFAPVILVNNEAKMLGESVMITVPAGETVEREWTTYLYSLDPYFAIYEDTPVTLSFFDESTYNFFLEDIHTEMTMRANPGAPNIKTASAPEVINGTKKPVTMLNPIPTYVTNNPGALEVKADLLLNEGYFAYPVYAVIIQPGSYNVIDYMGYEMFMSEPGEKQEFRVTVPFANATEGLTYEIMIGFSYGSQLYQIPNQRCAFIYDSNAAGITTAEAEGALTFNGTTLFGTGLIELYSIDGTKVASGVDTLSLNGVNSGIYVARNGNRTIKIHIK